MKNLFLTCILFFFLNACSSGNSYRQPPESAPTAFLMGYNEREAIITPDWSYARPESIDEKSIDYSILANPLSSLQLSKGDTVIKVTPGSHSIVIFTEFNHELFSNCPCSAYTNVTAQFEPGKHYKILSAQEGADIKTWIEEKETKSRISTVGIANFHSSPRDMIPIMMYSK